jgi:hypothetical protein
VAPALVTHAWLEREFAAVFEFGMKLPLSAKKYVALGAPMINKMARRVFAANAMD